MFFKCVTFWTQNDILSLHSQTHNAFHKINFSWIILEHFYPWKLCSSKFSTLAKNIVCFFKLLQQWLNLHMAKCGFHMLGVVERIKMKKTLKHTNCTVRLLCFNYDLESTLFLFKLTLEDGIGWNLSGITKWNESPRFWLDLKKEARHYLLYTSHSMLKPLHLHNIWQKASKHIHRWQNTRPKITLKKQQKENAWWKNWNNTCISKFGCIHDSQKNQWNDEKCNPIASHHNIISPLLLFNF